MVSYKVTKSDGTKVIRTNTKGGGFTDTPVSSSKSSSPSSSTKVSVVSDAPSDVGKSFGNTPITKPKSSGSGGGTKISVVSDAPEDKGKTFNGTTIQTSEEYAQTSSGQAMQQAQAQKIVEKIYEDPNRRDITNQKLRNQGFSSEQIAEIGRIQDRQRRQKLFEEEQAKKNLSFKQYEDFKKKKGIVSDREIEQEASRIKIKTEIKKIDNDKKLNTIQKEEKKRELFGKTAGTPKKQGLFQEVESKQDIIQIKSVFTTKEQNLLNKAIRKESMTPQELKELNQLAIDKNKQITKLQAKKIINIPKDVLSGAYEVGYEVGTITGKAIKLAYNYGYNTSKKAQDEKSFVIKYFAKDLGRVLTTPVKSAFKYGYNTSRVANENKQSVLTYFQKDAKASAILIGAFASATGQQLGKDLQTNSTKTLTKAIIYFFPETILSRGKLGLQQIKATTQFQKVKEVSLATTKELKLKAITIAKQTQFSTKIISNWSKAELTSFLSKFSRFETRKIKGKNVLVEKVTGKPLSKNELEKAKKIFSKKGIKPEVKTQYDKKDIKGLLQDKSRLIEFKPTKETPFKFPKKQFYTEDELKQAIIQFKSNPKELGRLREIARRQNLSFKIKTKKGKTKVILKESINIKKGIKTKREKKFEFEIKGDKIIKKEQTLTQEIKISPKEQRRLQKQAEFEAGQNLDKIQNDLRNFEKQAERTGLFKNKKAQVQIFKSFKKQTQKIKNESVKTEKRLKEKRNIFMNYQRKLKPTRQDKLNFQKMSRQDKVKYSRKQEQLKTKIEKIKQEIKQDTKKLSSQKRAIGLISGFASQLEKATAQAKGQTTAQAFKFDFKTPQSLKQTQTFRDRLPKPKSPTSPRTPKRQPRKIIKKVSKVSKPVKRIIEKGKGFPIRKIQIPKTPLKIPKPSLKKEDKKKQTFTKKGLFQYKDTKTKKKVIIKTNLPINKARKLALKGIDNSIQAKVKVIGYGRTKAKDIKPINNLKFKLNKKKEEVEKNRFRLDTLGEKRQISFAKAIKPSLKSRIKKKTTTKRVSRVSKPIRSKKVVSKPIKRVITKRSKKR